MLLPTEGLPNITNLESKCQFGIGNSTKLYSTGKDGGGTNNALKYKKIG
jgi:hypothetical protein